MFELKSGDRLGEWVVDVRIGAGGLAEVWRSCPNAQGRCVALKVLLDADRSPAHRGRFLREGRLLQRYPHGGLPRCMAVSEQPVPFLALELLEGETLADRLQRLGPLDPVQVEAVGASLLQVLDHLHQRGIVHRDVKPANIWLGEDRRTLLMDLGLAVDPNDPLTTTLGDVLGTYAYMAPEQISGAGLDQRADLYSLGITLYEALSGTRPFYAKGVAGYLRAHREGRYTPIRQLCPEAPPRLTDLITRLMARDPPARPTSAPVARASLTGEAAGVGRLRHAPLRGQRPWARSKRRWMPAAWWCWWARSARASAGSAPMCYEARERGIESIALRCRSRAPALEPIEQLARDLRGIQGPVEDSPEALSRALEGLAGEGGVLLLVEDCEECSPEAAAVLQHILAAVPRVALVCAGLQAPVGMKGHSVRLRPLNAEEVHAVVSGILGTQAPPAGLAERLHRMSGGLPAVIVLAVRELVERGSLWSEGLGDDGAPLWRMNRQAPIEPATACGGSMGPRWRP